MGRSKIEKLKKKLYRVIEAHGRDSPRVLEISQKLDLYIVKEMKKHKKKQINMGLRKQALEIKDK